MNTYHARFIDRFADLCLKLGVSFKIRLQDEPEGVLIIDSTEYKYEALVAAFTPNIYQVELRGDAHDISHLLGY